MKRVRKGIPVVMLLIIAMQVVAQPQKKDRGRINGGVESALGFYVKDEKLGNANRRENFGTNTFLNLGYEIGRFGFGVQYDIFEPPLLGFSPMLKGHKLMQGYASYTDSRLEIQIGTVFGQFGSGLLFRAYEDRPLAINTSLLGGRIGWRPWEWLVLKAVAGKPRKFMKYVAAEVYGADAELRISELLLPQSECVCLLGGSWMLRKDDSEFQYQLAPRTVRGYAGRVRFSKGPLSLGGEYIAKSLGLVHERSGAYRAGEGQGLLFTLGLDFTGIGCALEYRSLKFMDYLTDDADEEAVNLNYVPSLTCQHKYALLMLFPHEAKAVGETGGQFDIFGELPLKGRNSLDWSLNGAMYRQLKKKGEDDYYLMKTTGELMYAELGLELSRNWGRKLKATGAVVWQKKNEFSRLGHGNMLMNTEIVVADLLYRLTSKTSLRVEAQHAWSDSQDNQAWAYGLLEVGIAPYWMFYVSDMCNYKSAATPTHYFSAGGSFAWEKLRVSLAYGRNRGGMQCSGGVCRFVPEHSGVSVGLSFIF